MFKRIKYVSVAVEPFTSGQLDALLMKSRARNAEHGITGALMMAGSIFFQMLEGPAQAIDDTLARISRDRRHGSIQLLRSELVGEQRLFEGWSMKLVQPEDVRLRENVTVRALMERLEMAQRSARQLTAELEQSVWTHFAPTPA